VTGHSTALPWGFRPMGREEGKIRISDQSEKFKQLNNKTAKNVQAYTIFVKSYYIYVFICSLFYDALQQ
jgi:hypothetical protein